MKRVLTMGVLCALLVSAAGCATPYPTGMAYMQMTLPVGVTANDGRATKIGVAECKSYLGLVAMGDASIEAAKRNGGITQVHHVDWEVENILGVIGTYKLTVYGE